MNEDIFTEELREILLKVEDRGFRNLLLNEADVRDLFVKDLLQQIKVKKTVKTIDEKLYQKVYGLVLILAMRERNRYQITNRERFRELLKKECLEYKKLVKNQIVPVNDAVRHIYKEVQKITKHKKMPKSGHSQDIMLLVVTILIKYEIIAEDENTPYVINYILKNQRLPSQVRNEVRHRIRPIVQGFKK